VLCVVRRASWLTFDLSMRPLGLAGQRALQARLARLGKTIVCIFFWVSFVFSPDLVQVVFSFSIWPPIYFLWFEQGLFVFFW